MKFPVNKIYYINLKKAIWRNKNLLTHFAEIGLMDQEGNKPERIEASDGNLVPHPVKTKKELGHKGLAISTGEKGCFASHMKIIDLQIENGFESVLYLEDDVRFNKKILQEFANNRKFWPEGFDMINLSWWYFGQPLKQTIEPYPLNGMKQFYKGDGMWLTHAYILSLKGAIKVKESLPYQAFGLDWHYANIQTNMESYGFKRPHLATQDHSGTGMKSQIIHTS